MIEHEGLGKAKNWTIEFTLSEQQRGIKLGRKKKNPKHSWGLVGW